MAGDKDQTVMRPADGTSAGALPEGYLLHNNYRIVRVLGAGGFGVTYLAEHTHLHRKRVAIKEYLPYGLACRDARSEVHVCPGSDQSLYDWGRERFFAEANVLWRISQRDDGEGHKAEEAYQRSIVSVEDVFQANNTVYMVLEFVDGKSLAQIIDDMVRDGLSFDEIRLRKILIPLLDALSALHKKGLIHRDIKPSNIILTPTDERPVLIDFGAARADIESRGQEVLVSPTIP